MFANKVRSTTSLALLTVMVVFGVSACGADPDADSATEAQGTEERVGEQASAITSDDIRWALQHSAASGACAAASPETDSAWHHVVVPKPGGVTCTAACAANTGGTFTNCRTAIAVGTIRMTQAASYTNVVGHNYRYRCSDAFGGYDEVLGQGADSGVYTVYCCCYN